MKNILVLAVVAVFGAGVARAEPVKLKFAMFTGESEGLWTTTFKPFVDAVNAEGKGVVEIEPFLNGALGRSVAAQPQMVLDGVADMAFVIPAASPGRFADNSLIELPGVFNDLTQGSRAFTKLASSNVFRGYQDYKVLGAFVTPPYNLHSRKPLEKLADLKGMKLRTANESDRGILSALGAVPVLLAVNEAPEAIARGTVDAAEQHSVTAFDFGYDRVTKYSYYLDLGRAAVTLLMNKSKYDALPNEAKAILDKYSGDWIIQHFVSGFGAKNAELLAKLKNDRNRVSTVPSDADLRTANEVIKTFIAGWLTKDPSFPATLEKIHETVRTLPSNG